jgi:hypothetical protein
MPRKFVIGVEGISQQQEREFGSFLSEYGTWWHWLSNVWLLTTNRSDIDRKTIIDTIHEIDKHANAMILEVDNIKSYSSILPEKSSALSRNWISRYFVTRVAE